MKLLVLLSLMLPLLQGETPVNRPSSLSGAQVTDILIAWNSPLAEHASLIYERCQSIPLDCAWALAVWRKESQLGTDGSPNLSFYNFAGMTCGTSGTYASGCSGRWKTYDSWESAILDWFAYIPQRYFEQGLTTVEAITAVYAPPSENNTQQYIDQLNDWMREWGSGSVGSVPGGQDTGGGMWDDWLFRPLDGMYIEAARSFASGWWDWWSGVLRFVLTPNRLRVLVIEEGLRPLVEWLASDLLGIGMAALIVGWLVAMLGLVLALFFRSAFVSAKRVLAGTLLLPVLLPMAGPGLQSVDTFRANLGSEIENEAFTRSGGLLDRVLGVGSVAPSDLIGTVAPFDPSVSDARHGDAVLAAYIFASIDDVLHPEADLPKEFIRVYFPQTDADLANAEAPTREEAKTLAWAGVKRMITAIVPAAFAVLETIIQLLWSLGLGFLVLALVLASPFFWLEPVLVFVYSLARQALYLLFSSLGMSFFVGLVNAFVFGAATQGSAGAVMATAGLGILFLLVFGAFAIRSVWQAFTGIGAAVTAGRLAATDYAQGWSTARSAVQQTGGAAVDVGQGVHRGAKHAHDNYAGAKDRFRETAAAYGVAAPGTTARYAAAYALGDVPALAHVGALARVMGYQLPEDIKRGLYTRQTAGRQDPLSERAVRGIERDAKALKGATP